MTTPNLRRMTDEDLTRINGMLAEGMSYAEISRTTGWAVSAVSRRFPGRGWSMSRGAEQRLMNAQLRKVGDLL